MRPERDLAIRLRKSGRSYNDIARSLSVPKSTLATWFRDVVLPQRLLNRLYSRARSAGTQALVARNKRQTLLAQERSSAIQEAAQAEIGRLTRRELQLIGAALYWAEGAKRQPLHRGRRALFSNADPAMVRLMMRFFREVCGVPKEKFRVQLVVAPGISFRRAVHFWSTVTGVPAQQFPKVAYQLSQASRRVRPHGRLPYGTAQIRIADTQLFDRMMGWIDGLCQPQARNAA